MSILLLFTGFIIAFAILFYYEYKIRQIIRTAPKNKVHFYVARDKNGSIYLYLGKPQRGSYSFLSSYRTCSTLMVNKNRFKNFGLNPDDFNNLKWEDEPVEVFINMED